MVSVQETTVRLSATPPPFNLIVTVPSWWRINVWDPLVKGKSDREYNLLRDDDVDMDSAEAKAAEKELQSKAKKAKQKVAKKLLRKLKLSEEQMPMPSEDSFQELRENQHQMAESLQTIMRQLSSQAKGTRPRIGSPMMSTR